MGSYVLTENPERSDETLTALVVAADRPATRRPVYPVTDALGSWYGVTDSSGAPELGASYDAYGRPTPMSSPGLPVAFQGRTIDESGLLYARSRYLDPVLGLWLRPDPLSESRLRGDPEYAFSDLGARTNPESPPRAASQTYVFAHRSPTMWVDPTGLRADLSSSEWLRWPITKVRVLYLYRMLASDSRAHAWFAKWGRPDPFFNVETFYMEFHHYLMSAFIGVQELIDGMGNVLSDTGTWTHDIYITEAGAELPDANLMAQVIMHELNNWSFLAEYELPHDNSLPDGSYTAENTAYDIYYDVMSDHSAACGDRPIHAPSEVLGVSVQGRCLKAVAGSA